MDEEKSKDYLERLEKEYIIKIEVLSDCLDCIACDLSHTFAGDNPLKKDELLMINKLQIIKINHALLRTVGRQSFSSPVYEVGIVTSVIVPFT